MRKGLLVIMFLGWLFGPPSAVQNAAESYKAQKYAEAVAAFSTAHDNYPRQHAALNFNTAQCWLHLDSLAQATSWYGKVTNASQQAPQMGSWAWNNLGCIFASAQPAAGPMGGPQGAMPAQGAPMGAQQGGANPMDQLAQALQAFKDALKLDHDNEFARYNYELIKRKMQQQQQQQDQQQDQQDQQQDEQQKKENQDQQKGKDQQQESPQNQENKGNQGQQKPGEGEAQQMSPEEAKRLLDAMNANEKKFLQQIEKGKKHRTYNEDGPDW